MKKLLVGVVVVLGLVGINFDKVLLASMDLVDAYGQATGSNVVETIDDINEIYYSLYE